MGLPLEEPPNPVLADRLLGVWSLCDRLIEGNVAATLEEEKIGYLSNICDCWWHATVVQ